MKVSVVIPSYKVKAKILSVLEKIGPEVTRIYIVDDKCPESSGDFVRDNSGDPRVEIIYHEKNLGVGGAVISGYKKAIEEDMDIVVKIDGDGQMNPEIIHSFIAPILSHQFDYTKGNRFYRIEDVQKMPAKRLFGNTALSFLSKASTGYWQLFDPTNGYTAISVACLRNLELDKISKRYFFESDLLFRLNIIGANIKDVPMKAIYEDEESNLRISRIFFPFVKGHIVNFSKRILYNYFLREFSLATISLVFGLLLTGFGVSFGIMEWYKALETHTTASSGTVMLAALPVIIGTQLLLSFINYDISKSLNLHRATFEIKA
jgi:dolichol-phosphate mannosyltransferase